VFVGQDAGHVLIGVAGMDDQRQAGATRGLDMEAQAVLAAPPALSAV
jgi:hypothetical protein